MDTTIRIQFYIFLTSIYGGLIAGLAYDFYKISRYYFKPRKIVTTIEDLFFWVSLALIFFYILNKTNGVELRGYIFLGFFGGVLIYFKVLSKFLSPLITKSFYGIKLLITKASTIIILFFKHIKKMALPKFIKIKKFSRIPKEAIYEIKRYKKIISKKK
jgi:spore cortex biosynthesis protein YabQ